MGNNHTVALIEQRMCEVWARQLDSSGKETTLKNLIEWMTTEMRFPMRATAPLKTQANQQDIMLAMSLSAEAYSVKASSLPHKCWVLCQISKFWKFISSSPIEKLMGVKENHACFSCLTEQAGRDHWSLTCSRRR